MMQSAGNNSNIEFMLNIVTMQLLQDNTFRYQVRKYDFLAKDKSHKLSGFLLTFIDLQKITQSIEYTR